MPALASRIHVVPLERSHQDCTVYVHHLVQFGVDPGRYEERGRLGEGAAGEVVRVLDRACGREVALKRVRLDDDASVEIFARELRALRGLAHPHLARLLDLGFGADARGRFGFYTSPLLPDAVPLDAWARGRAEDALRRALRGPVGALAALHDAGLMHGDLSASNLLVDRGGHATLIDLGCARPLGEPLHTLDGTHPAPEILRGGRASIAIDLYALGATLAPLVDPAGALGALARRCVAVDPAGRPADAREVLEALGVSAPPPPRAGAAFVGRSEARRRFEAWIGALLAGAPGPRVFAIEGPAGVGRSRLLEEWKWIAQRALTVDEAVGPPASALGDLLERWQADDLPALLSRVNADPRPTLWLVDDLDRAPADRRAALLRLARALEPTDRAGLVVVGGLPDDVPAERERLGPLSLADLRRWLGDGPSEQTLERLHEVTGGVPADVQRALASHHVDPADALAEPLPGDALAGLDDVAREALVALACGGQPAGPALEALRAAGWVDGDGAGYRLRRPGDRARILGAVEPHALREVHLRLAEGAVGSRRVVHLARAGALDEAEAALGAIEGDPPHAEAEAARALARVRPSLRVAELLERTGHAAEALGVLARLRRGASPGQVAELRLRAGRCRLALGDPAAALRHLTRARSEPSVRAAATRAIGQAYLRRGDPGQAVEALRGESDPDARALLGVALSYRGEHAEARLVLAEAARGPLAPRARLRVVSFAAIDAYREGRLAEAAEGYREAYRLARAHRFEEQLPQAALNLATIEHRLGELGPALRRYDEALRWARALGRVSTEVTLRLNRARLHGELGGFERAREGLSIARELAEAKGLAFLAAESYALEAELAWMEGAPGGEAAAERAIDAFEGLEASRERDDTRVVLAHLAIDGGDLASAAAALDAVDSGHGADLRARALEARALLAVAEGRGADALRALDEARRLADGCGEPELGARLAARAAQASLSLGAPHAAEAARRDALARWDRAAATLPEAMRDRYWGHPFRRGLRDAAPEPPRGQVGASVRRLLGVAARVAGALDPDEVLELAMDSAVELTGAERGFVLLSDPRTGELEVAVARNFDREDLTRAGDKFSRTIAERAIASGGPVLTAEAHEDARFTGGRSIHAMQLRSVLAAPIRTREATLGALYVDNRFQRGRFDESHVELLAGFADQVAVALTNARLHRELEARTRELAAEREAIAALLARKTAEVERLAAAPRVEHGLVGRSRPMRELVASIRRLADAPVTVLIEGESGTGKELVARAIHDASRRAAEPFVSVNCGAIPEALLESELFGHVRGAFTGAARDRRGLFLEAGEGTLFLDEIGEMPMGMQVKLLRVLQQREVRPVGATRTEPLRARVLAATNRTLREEVRAGRFREDLYYRVAVVELRVPPLRDRAEDIPELAAALLERVAAEGGPRARLTASAARALAEQPWPGNVRELENVLRATAVFAEGGRVTADALVLPRERAQPDERQRIAAALEEHGWNVSRVGRALGIPRMTLYRRLRQYGLERPGG